MYRMRAGKKRAAFARRCRMRYARSIAEHRHMPLSLYVRQLTKVSQLSWHSDALKRAHGLVAQCSYSIARRTYAGTLHEEHARSNMLVQQVQPDDAAPSGRRKARAMLRTSGARVQSGADKAHEETKQAAEPQPIRAAERAVLIANGADCSGPRRSED